uniref:Uncharacterized protein n=1 Tax=Eucampia antarctica TaxID=49252 RepID=A0A7S2QZQ4_9STRA|mmetsp:Transcript_10491/g.10058  ORF Transcript_10491/g.10058 Transcript_10491/m.10058 type:complete len:137 (+) Transcript_10491:37-447(+)
MPYYQNQTNQQHQRIKLTIMLSRIFAFNTSRRYLFIFHRTATRVTGNRFLSIHSELSKKERVEEERYIREIEHQKYLVRKAEKDDAEAIAKMTAAEEERKAEMDTIIGEVFSVLSETGEKISDAAVENFASWKLGK